MERMEKTKLNLQNVCVRRSALDNDLNSVVAQFNVILNVFNPFL